MALQKDVQGSCSVVTGKCQTESESNPDEPRWQLEPSFDSLRLCKLIRTTFYSSPSSSSSLLSASLTLRVIADICKPTPLPLASTRLHSPPLPSSRRSIDFVADLLPLNPALSPCYPRPALSSAPPFLEAGRQNVAANGIVRHCPRRQPHFALFS
jgi:hypothetical protein